VLAALNFSEQPRTVTLDIPVGGVWRDIVGDRVYELDRGIHQFDLKTWQGLLLIPLSIYQ
jgi:hypothetical protein